METKYVGTRTADGCRVEKVAEGKNPERLDLHHKLWRHSLSFEWGYSGSGPAQLALALLADATGNDRLAVSLHQDFKRAVVGTFPRDGGFELDAARVHSQSVVMLLPFDLLALPPFAQRAA